MNCNKVLKGTQREILKTLNLQYVSSEFVGFDSRLLHRKSAVFAALFLFRVASTKLSISGIISKEFYKGVIDKL
ncbi:MAG: hypothetical protein EGR48_00645 [Lachnospiraceae bacterium]|nr:hypothetical protein [Lachnospiraceae bacterium]